MLSERRVSETLEGGAGPGEGVGPARLVFKLGEQPRSDLLLLGERKLRNFCEGLFEERGHSFTESDSTLSEQPNDIKLSGERSESAAGMKWTPPL
jgi:hypothetical protein